MQSAVWLLSEQQISAGDFIPVEIGSAGVGSEHEHNVMSMREKETGQD